MEFIRYIQNNGNFIKYIYVRILYVYEGQTWMCSIFMICIFILNYAEGAGITQLVEVHILYIQVKYSNLHLPLILLSAKQTCKS